MTDEEPSQPSAPEPVGQPPEASSPVTIENPDSAQTKAAPSEPIKAPLADAKPLDEAQSETAQIPVNEPFGDARDSAFDDVRDKPIAPAPEPLGNDQDKPIAPALERITLAAELPPAASIALSEPSAPGQSASPTTASSANISRDLLKKARSAIQERKRKKLGKIMELLNAKGKITNDEVEKLLHVSDATATRYLSLLEKEGKVKQVGKTGTGVAYAKGENN